MILTFWGRLIENCTYGFGDVKVKSLDIHIYLEKKSIFHYCIKSNNFCFYSHVCTRDIFSLVLVHIHLFLLHELKLINLI